jgi:hypothetical protein
MLSLSVGALVPTTFGGNLLNGFSLSPISLQPIDLLSSGLANSDSSAVNSPTSTGLSSVFTAFPSLTWTDGLQTVSPANDVISSPFTTVDNSAWGGTPMTSSETQELDQQNEAYQNAPLITQEQEQLALNIVSQTSMYKEYMQYPNTGWSYQWAYPYDGHTVMMSCDINPNMSVYDSGSFSQDELYNPNAPCSGQLSFTVDIDNGTILNQNFGSFQDAM